MNTEDNEFKRIEMESGWRKRQVQASIEDDDDIQDYKKPWVGLTDEEIEHAYMKFYYTKDFVDMARVLEDILKDKNT